MRREVDQAVTFGRELFNCERGETGDRAGRGEARGDRPPQHGSRMPLAAAPAVWLKDYDLV
jgi:hypothetical protein